jgi:hypothetical protein
MKPYPVAAAVLLLAVIIGGAALGVFAAPPRPAIVAAAQGDECVEPVDVMRRRHMDFLTHLRDKTVHQGIRGERHSLIDCVACHAQKDQTGAYIPINDEGQFCQSCHAYAAVRIDCFECHSSIPEAADSD